MSTGKLVEDRIQQVCERLFFPDFTVRSPVYSKTRGREKEAADILIPFGDQLLIFQIKTKQEEKRASEKTDTDFERIRRKVDEAIGQIQTAISAVKNQRFHTLRTVRGLDIAFDSKGDWTMLGLVVIDLLGEEKYPEEDRTAIYNGYTRDSGIPTHIFLRATFEAIASELDTLPDLLQFLALRQKLLESGVLVPISDDRDLLALYKMNSKLIKQAAEGGCDALVVSAGSWEAYREQYAHEIARRDRRNDVSFLVDGAISWLHQSIGYRIEAGIPQELDFEQGTVKAYLGAARAFASLTRLERRGVGETLKTVMERAAAKGDAYAVWRRADTDWAVLCFSTARSREERYRAMLNLSTMAFCHLGLKRLLGIATEPINERERSFDFPLLEGEPFDSEERKRFAEKAKSVFGTEQRIRVNNWGTRSS